jgi:hypothetical protein
MVVFYENRHKLGSLTRLGYNFQKEREKDLLTDPCTLEANHYDRKKKEEHNHRGSLETSASALKINYKCQILFRVQ